MTRPRKPVPTLEAVMVKIAASGYPLDKLERLMSHYALGSPRHRRDQIRRRQRERLKRLTSLEEKAKSMSELLQDPGVSDSDGAHVDRAPYLKYRMLLRALFELRESVENIAIGEVAVDIVRVPEAARNLGTLTRELQANCELTMREVAALLHYWQVDGEYLYLDHRDDAEIGIEKIAKSIGTSMTRLRAEPAAGRDESFDPYVSANPFDGIPSDEESE